MWRRTCDVALTMQVIDPCGNSNLPNKGKVKKIKLKKRPTGLAGGLTNRTPNSNHGNHIPYVEGHMIEPEPLPYQLASDRNL
jgi:hypothetical protein